MLISLHEHVPLLIEGLRDPEGWIVDQGHLLHTHGCVLWLDFQTRLDQPSTPGYHLPHAHMAVETELTVDGQVGFRTFYPKTQMYTENILPKNAWTAYMPAVTAPNDRYPMALEYWKCILRLNFAPPEHGGTVRLDLIKRAQREVLQADPQAVGIYRVMTDPPKNEDSTSASFSAYPVDGLQNLTLMGIPLSDALNHDIHAASLVVPFVRFNRNSLTLTASNSFDFVIPASAHARVSMLKSSGSDTSS